MTQVVRTQKAEAIAHFQYEGRLIQDVPFGNGHINDTYLLTFEVKRMGILKVILQKMNKNVFKNPVELMENILGVTSYLREKIIKNGGDPDRETLNVIPALDGKPYYQDSFGDYWRSYIFITDASSYDQVENPDQFYQAAMAFGNFQNLLADYPADTLFETIEGFHDTKARFEVFKRAVETDIKSRAADVKKEIQFVLDHEDVACCFSNLQAKGEIPLRVTHNDTKLNNIMIDNKTGKAICVIDLDTVMPGLVGHDFGDAIRFAANFVEEDSPEADKAGVNLNIYWAFAEGFIQKTASTLTETEVDTLGLSCFALACELATRFLDDYIVGDKYFKIKYEKHNLTRTRCQIALAKDMLLKMDAMNAIVKDCWVRYKDK